MAESRGIQEINDAVKEELQNAVMSGQGVMERLRAQIEKILTETNLIALIEAYQAKTKQVNEDAMTLYKADPENPTTKVVSHGFTTYYKKAPKELKPTDFTVYQKAWEIDHDSIKIVKATLNETDEGKALLKEIGKEPANFKVSGENTMVTTTDGGFNLMVENIIKVYSSLTNGCTREELDKELAKFFDVQEA